jgi:hypothetical protein
MDAKVKWLASCFPSHEMTPERNPSEGGFGNRGGISRGIDNVEFVRVTASGLLTINFAYAT